jgi:hypothetical protein
MPPARFQNSHGTRVQGTATKDRKILRTRKGGNVQRQRVAGGRRDVRSGRERSYPKYVPSWSDLSKIWKYLLRSRNRGTSPLLLLPTLALAPTPHPPFGTFSPSDAEKGIEAERAMFWSVPTCRRFFAAGLVTLRAKRRVAVTAEQNRHLTLPSPRSRRRGNPKR